jgi:hypothetical protein
MQQLCLSGNCAIVAAHLATKADSASLPVQQTHGVTAAWTKCNAPIWTGQRVGSSGALAERAGAASAARAACRSSRVLKRAVYQRLRTSFTLVTRS